MSGTINVFRKTERKDKAADRVIAKATEEVMGRIFRGGVFTGRRVMTDWREHHHAMGSGLQIADQANEVIH